MDSLKDKVVLITGASEGIGASTAKLFAKYGSKVILMARSKERLEKVAQECRDLGLPAEKVLVVPGDLSKDDDIKRLVDTTIETFNTVDVLVNNAGIANMPSTFETLTMEAMEDVYKVNQRAPVYLTKLLIPHLKRSKGSVINVSSLASQCATVQFGWYCMTKAALDMFTCALALELAPHGVRVNSVNPGQIKTAMQAKAGILEENQPEYYEKFNTIQPMGRPGEPEEVAHVIAFLASEGASYMSGCIVPVDGALSKTTSWFQMENDSLKGQAVAPDHDGQTTESTK